MPTWLERRRIARIRWYLHGLRGKFRCGALAAWCHITFGQLHVCPKALGLKMNPLHVLHLREVEFG